MEHEWICPLCVGESAVIVRLTDAALRLAVMTHIIGHERRAAQRAVDRARLECRSSECSLGCSRQWSNDERKLVPKLTDFDKTFLSDMKIKTDE